ncbi:sce7725 family protein [Acidovorax sp. SUPP3334]|uniref:sce7725 family protein n=1 Tax=Acidovorax sp. SUPP3334 TaxID=2920881 RepID=UPI0023DE1D42|nr:sce7725 family protein [Acidovorax sp. SUPP3334]GKT21077.1 hypothetical protein AVHM3334_03465 [Acidovorax sp. SUPP3334]
MYFPYFYAKQKELLAVRQLSGTLVGDDAVQAVFEPVKQDSSTLRITLDVCEGEGLINWIVVNPELLEFRSLTSQQSWEWGQRALGKLKTRSSTRATLMLSTSTSQEIIGAFNDEYRGESVGLVVQPSLANLDAVIKQLSKVNVQRVFFKGPGPSTANMNLVGLNKCVWVEDRFPHQSRNADYVGRHFFTDRHLTYKSMGLAGFSDYTILPPTPSDGGGPPGAVAFHMSYINLEKPSKELWVEHFVSDETDQKVKNNNGKFLEALRKYERAVKRQGSSFGLTEAAKDYLSRAQNGNSPSLGTNKQLEVMHHLELVSGVLVGRF